MADNTKIEWADASWNPIRARVKEPIAKMRGGELIGIIQPWGYHCERVSPGCKNCYAATMNGRMLPAWGTGLDYTVPNREKVEIFLDEKEMFKPMKWKKPRRIFVCSMTDLFAEFVSAIRSAPTQRPHAGHGSPSISLHGSRPAITCCASMWSSAGAMAMDLRSRGIWCGSAIRRCRRRNRGPGGWRGSCSA